MPAYVLEFLSGDAPQRRRYTLDDDRPLRGQLEQVLADLERAGVVLHGGPADELAVYWAGRELDQQRAPAELGVTADRPLELRMQRRRPAIALPVPAPEAPAESFVPRGVYAGATLGASAGAAAWGLAVFLADRTARIDSDARVDGAAAVLWGVLVGVAVLAGQARRVGAGGWRGAAGGLLAGGFAALVWAVARDERWMGTEGGALWRVGVWATLAALVAAALAGVARVRWLRATAAPEARSAPGALARAGGWALLAGAASGGLGLLPGEPALWQALAATLGGAGVGAAVAWAATHAAPALFELEADGERPVGVATLREWALPVGATVYLRDGAAAAGGRAAIVGAGGRYHLYADAATRAARELRHDDRLVLGAARYRFRRRVVA